jgi:hypothetical protein
VCVCVYVCVCVCKLIYIYIGLTDITFSLPGYCWVITSALLKSSLFSD